MKIGVMIFPTDKSIQPIQLAKEVEARGFEVTSPSVARRLGVAERARHRFRKCIGVHTISLSDSQPAPP